MSPITIKSGKTVLTPAETALVIEGLEAGARENMRLAQDAVRLGYRAQANGFAQKGEQFAALAATARSVSISKMTVRHS